MKKLIFISNFLLISASCLAQNGLTGILPSGEVLKKQNKLIERILTKEFTTSKSPNILFDSKFLNFEIRTWDKPSVKIELTESIDSALQLSDDQAWDNASITASANGNQVSIVSKSRNAYTILPMGKATTLPEDHTAREDKSNSEPKRKMIAYLPEESLIQVKGKFLDVLMSTKIRNLELNISNSYVQGQRVGHLKIDAKFSNVTIGDVSSAKVTYNQGMFLAKHIDSLTIKSQSSIYELKSISTAIIESINDNFEFETVGELDITKKLGRIRIDTLTKKLNLSSEGVDIKIKSLTNSVSGVRIVNGLDFVNVPLTSIASYSVTFRGDNSTVYAPFDVKYEKTPSGLSAQPPIQVNAGNISSQSSFKHRQGKTTDKFLTLDMNCNQCTIDLR